MKDFMSWMPYKQNLDSKDHRPPFVTEGDVWWISIGENIGSEIDGKSHHFSRPAIIFKKLSHNFYLIIPTTTKNRLGTWYVPFIHQSKPMVACLQQARSIDHRRLSSKLGTLDHTDMLSIRSGFKALYCPD